MKIILLKDVPKVGRKFEVKDVAEGFATNMLLPRKLAIIATKSAIEKLELEKSKSDAERKIQTELLEKNLDRIKGTTITLHEKANEKGHLFAGVTKERIIEELEKAERVSLHPDWVMLDKPIKEAGKHEIVVKLPNKKVEFYVSIL
jgi:large subunit ribosomal protein L9